MSTLSKMAALPRAAMCPCATIGTNAGTGTRHWRPQPGAVDRVPQAQEDCPGAVELVERGPFVDQGGDFSDEGSQEDGQIVHLAQPPIHRGNRRPVKGL